MKTLLLKFKRFFFFLTFPLLMQLTSFFISYYFYKILSLSLFYFLFLSQLFFLGTLIFIFGMIFSNQKRQFLLKRVGSIYLGFFSLFFTIIFFFWFFYFFSLPFLFLFYGPLIMVFFFSIFSLYFGQKITIKHIQLNALNQACRVVHLSDLHFNGLKSVEWVQEMVERINELSPDIVVITGDLLDIDPIFLNEHIKSLNEIKCSKKYVVSGNHDFYLGYELFKQFVLDINFKLLDFDSELILRPDQKNIKVLGLPDDVTTDSRVASFFNDYIDDSAYHILLRHKPICFKQSVDHGIQLQLSGHTHHGQLPPFNFLVRLFFRFSHGFYRYKQGVIYTSPGTSTWGPNMRLFSSSEITVINL